MRIYNRAQWGARPSRGGPGPLDPEQVVGVALHWPAMTEALRTIPDVMAALRSWQAFHIDTRGWSDIAYQEAFDQAGNVYTLRGLANQSGANGDTDVNERFGAFLLILAPGEHPTEEMIASVRVRIDAHRAMFPKSRQIVGHNQIRPEPTACPGPITQGLINGGVFEPRKPGPTPEEKAAKLAAQDQRAREEATDLAQALKHRPGLRERVQNIRDRIGKPRP